MAFAKRGFHTFSDNISFAMWGSDAVDAVGGDGAISLESQPVAPGTEEPRDKCLRFHSSGGAGTGYVRHRIQYLPHGQTMNTANIVESFDDIWFRARMLVAHATAPSSGSIALLEFGHGDEPVYRVVRNSTGTLTLSAGASGSGSLSALGTGSTVITDNEWFEIILSVDQSAATATLKLKRENDSSYSTEVAATSVASASEVATFALGPTVNTLADNGETSIYVDDFAISDRREADVLSRYYDIGSGCRDVGSDKLALAFFYPTGLFQSATHVRVQYSTDSSFGSATSFVALSSAASSIVPISVTSLAAGTRYNYRFQVATSASASDVIWTSPTYQARTLYAAAPPFRRAFSTGCCAAQVGLAHPYDQVEKILDKTESDGSDWLGHFSIGDQGYETTDFGVVALDPQYNDPPETAADFERILREYVADHAYYELLRAGLFLGQPDDHAWINDGDSRHAPGGALASTLANDWALKQATYTAGRTLSQLWTAGLGVFDDWFSDHLMDRPSAGVRYKSWVDGDTRFVLMDTRTERNPAGTPIMVSSTQLAWLQGQVDAFSLAAPEKYLVFLCNGGWNQLNTKATEGWERVASAQYYAWITYLQDELPTTKRMFVLRGDDHAGYSYQQRQETESNVVTTNPAIGPEMIFSGTAITAFPSTDNEGTIQRYRTGDTGYPAASSMLRISPGLLSIDSEHEVINAKSWSLFEGDGLDVDIVSLDSENTFTFNSIFGLGSHTQPGPNEIAAYMLQESSGTAIADLLANLAAGTLSGAANPTTVTGPTSWLTSAIEFDGSDDRVELPAAIKVGGAVARTYTMWVNAEIFGTGSELAFLDLGGNDAVSNNGRGLTLHFEDNAISVGFFGNRRISPKTALSTDTWYFVALRVPDVPANTGAIELWIGDANVSLSTEAGSNQAVNTLATQPAWLGYYAAGNTGAGSYSTGRIAGLTCHHEYSSNAKIAQIKAGPEPVCTINPTIS